VSEFGGKTARVRSPRRRTARRRYRPRSAGSGRPPRRRRWQWGRWQLLTARCAAPPRLCLRAVCHLILCGRFCGGVHERLSCFPLAGGGRRFQGRLLGRLSDAAATVYPPRLTVTAYPPRGWTVRRVNCHTRDSLPFGAGLSAGCTPKWRARPRGPRHGANRTPRRATNERRREGMRLEKEGRRKGTRLESGARTMYGEESETTKRSKQRRQCTTNIERRRVLKPAPSKGAGTRGEQDGRPT
jgi:hypothetical protein